MTTINLLIFSFFYLTNISVNIYIMINNCQYETTKDNVSNFVSIINKYHPNGDLTASVNGNIVKFTVMSDTTSDFFNILPSFNFSNKYTTLNQQQLNIKNIIENLFFQRLHSKKSNEIFLNQYFEPILFDKLLQIAMGLKYSVKLFPNPSEQIIYIGIGSKNLGLHVMCVFTDHVSDCICPHFNINNGFIDSYNNIKTLFPYSSKNEINNIIIEK